MSGVLRVLHCTANISHCVLYKRASHYVNSYDTECFCDSCLSGFALIFYSTIRTIADTFISLSLCLWQTDTEGWGYGDTRMWCPSPFTVLLLVARRQSQYRWTLFQTELYSAASCLKGFVSILQLEIIPSSQDYVLLLYIHCSNSSNKM